MSRDFELGFCVSGGGRLMRAAVANAAILGIRPALVVLDAKADPGLEGFCDRFGVRYIRLSRAPREELDSVLFSACTSQRLDLLSLTFDRILSPAMIRYHAGRVINVHPALLPAYPGLDALERAARGGGRFSGATIHEADEIADHGPILAQCVVGTRPGESGRELGARLFPHLRLMYLQVLAWYAAGRVEKDADGRLLVRGAAYGDGPISPAVELVLPERREDE